MSKVTKKIFEVWYYPVSIFILASLLIALISTEHFYRLNNFEDSLNLFLSGEITLLATFVGILAPLMVEKAWRSQGDKRRMVFALSSVWNELREIRESLISFEKNYLFKATIDDPQLTLETKIDLIATKIDSFKPIVDLIPNFSYQTMISSETITLLKTDDLYNSISQTYENIGHFKNQFAVVRSALFLRNKLISIMPVSGTEFESHIKKEVEDRLKDLYAELLLTKNKVVKTIEDTDKVLSDLGIRSEEVPKEMSEDIELPGPKNVKEYIKSIKN